MPTITVEKEPFYKELGRTYTTKEFDELCFDYGLELDEDTEQTAPNELPHKLKIEIPANRYDLLCHEGLVTALRIFCKLEKPAAFKLTAPLNGVHRTVRVAKEVSEIRPYFAGAILRNLSFTPQTYASFIDLQDKLHMNLARKRSLVAIGTHDLDKFAQEGDLRYMALPPDDIKFAPLNKQQEYTATQLMELYTTDKHLSRYLHLVKDAPRYPIIYDANNDVLSMPPIINSDKTKITLETKNVFIDLTAVDKTKLQIVTDIICAMFSRYCAVPNSVEQVQVIYEDGTTELTPSLAPTTFKATSTYINSCTGLNLTKDEIAVYFERMGHAVSSGPGDELNVIVPPTRPDILHECDLMEEVAIAYGFNNLPWTFPTTNTVAQAFDINKLGDVIRKECAYAGWVEVAPLILCSHEENFDWLNRKNDGKTAVTLSNPKTIEYQQIRTSLLPGLLKSLRENKKHALPLRIFEVSDVAVKDSSKDNKSRNIRRMGACFMGKSGGFEVAHGLLGRVMKMLDVALIDQAASEGRAGYYIKEADDATYFPGRSAKIFYRPAAEPTVPTATVATPSQPASQAHEAALASSPPAETSEKPKSLLTKVADSILPPVKKDVEIGTLGILHPSVLDKFEIEYPVSSFEIDIEQFL